jgi:hypothetical protein
VKPDFSLGCFDALDAAISQFENPILIEVVRFKKAEIFSRL